MPETIHITWEKLDEILDRTALSILNSETNIDCILGLSRGGLVPAVMLANKLSIDKVYSYGLRSYTGDVGGDIKTYQHIGNCMGSESKILVVDDISDKGTTLGFVKRQICTDGPLNYVHKDIYTCTICIKEGTDFLPTWYEETYDKDDWIVFPWETV